MSIKLGFKKSSIAITALLLSIGMTAKAGVVYDYIKNNNELMIATDANWAPFSYINDAGEMEGFAVSRRLRQRSSAFHRQLLRPADRCYGSWPALRPRVLSSKAQSPGLVAG